MPWSPLYFSFQQKASYFVAIQGNILVMYVRWAVKNNFNSTWPIKYPWGKWVAVFLGNFFPSKFVLKKKGTTHGGWRCSFCANWCVGHNLWPTKRTWERGGRAPVGHGLGNLLDKVLATVVGPVHATITSSIAQWWNRCVISGKRWLHYHWHSSIAYRPRTQYPVQHHSGASTAQMVHYHWHNAMVRRTSIEHGTNTWHAHHTWYSTMVGPAWYRWYSTIDAAAPWWGWRRKSGQVALLPSQAGRAH